MQTPEQIAKKPIRVGTSWTDAKGRTWEVYEIRPFGRAMVRSGALFGEMRVQAIREILITKEARRG